MRTTVILPDALADQAKQWATAQGRTFTSVVEEGLRTVLADADADRGERIELPVHRGGAALVDILDKDAVWNALDELDSE